MLGDSLEDLLPGMILKLMVIRDLRERLCFISGEDAGQSGDSFKAFVSLRLFVDGVRDGTQKDGRVGFAACTMLALASTQTFRSRPSLLRVLFAPWLALPSHS